MVVLEPHSLGLGSKGGEDEPRPFPGCVSLFSAAGFKSVFSHAAKEGFSNI